MFGPAGRAIVHHDDATRLQRELAGSYRKGEVFDTEYRLRTARRGIVFIGRKVPLRDDAGKVEGGSHATDIEDDSATEAACAKSEATRPGLIEKWQVRAAVCSIKNCVRVAEGRSFAQRA